jgi:hypothetical protein
MKPKKKISPSDLRRQAEAMIAAGTMPSLETVLKAIAEVRTEYVPLINHAPVAQTQLSFVTDDREQVTLELNDYDRTFLSELRIEVPEDARCPLDGDSAHPEAL